MEGIEKWTIAFDGCNGEIFIAKFGDRMCDKDGRCGFAISYEELSDRVVFIVDPGFGTMIELMSYNVTWVCDRAVWETL